MSTEKLVEKFGQQIGRRAFLAKLGASAVGALLGLIGIPETASATHGGTCPPGTVHYKCCCLCHWPSTSCAYGCPSSWCWTCEETTTGYFYRCCECKDQGAPCTGACGDTYKSWIQFAGTAPMP